MKLASHSASTVTKLLACGYSGSGKTGALAALAAEGYKLRIADFDNGLDILFGFLTNPKSPYFQKNPKAVENVEFLSFHSQIKSNGGKLLPSPTAWPDFCNAMENWADYEVITEPVLDPKTKQPIVDNGKPRISRKRVLVPGSERGSIYTWGSDVVFVVDSFTGANDAALDYTMQLNARLGQSIRESDWGDGQQLVKKLLSIVTAPEVGCNVILNCHIKDVAKENEPARLMPAALGKALGPEVPRFFNTMLEFKNKGSGKRVILTQQIGMGLELKTSAPLLVEKEYDLEWGLVKYFNAARGTGR